MLNTIDMLLGIPSEVSEEGPSPEDCNGCEYKSACYPIAEQEK